MRVLLMPEPGFARREGVLLRRLATGLADEGVRVLNAVDAAAQPAGFGSGSSLGLFATDVAYAPKGLPFTGPTRARLLAEAAASLPGESGLQVVHAMGVGAWDLAWHAARHVHAALVLEIWSPQMVEQSARWLGGREPANVWLSVADPALALHASVRVPPACKERVVACPWGVHLGQTQHRAIDPTSQASILLWAGDGWTGDLTPALQGLSKWTTLERGLALLADDATSRRLGLWSLARRAGLEHMLSIVPGDLAGWEPALDADALLIPGATGEQSGLVLAAQGAGMPVIAQADELASNLIDALSARLVALPTPAAWQGAIAGVLDDPASAATLGQSARAYIQEHRLAYHWVSKVVELYERIGRRI